MSVFLTLKTFGPHFTVDKDKNVTHFLFLRDFRVLDFTMMCIYKCEKMLRMSLCVSIVMYE